MTLTLPLTTPVATSPLTLPKVRIMGVDFAAIDEDAVSALFVDRGARGLGCWVVTANLDHLRRFARDPEVRGVIGQADVVVADGMPIVMASRFAALPLPARVAGSALTPAIAARAAERGASLFLLGGDPGVAERAAAQLAAGAPGLRVAGTYCPPFGFENDADEVLKIELALLEAAPDLVLVAMSFPKTDLLIDRLRRVLPGASFMGVGIALSFVVGDVGRAPDVLQRAGLEWLHRLVQEPGRLWRRYLVHGLPFAVRLLAAAVLVRMQAVVGGPWYSIAADRGEPPAIGAPDA
jgi:N-acetylglucosaminyldiphosphoundecaprenol N-acetyl-beta-D-mannosaminyltransferase